MAGIGEGILTNIATSMMTNLYKNRSRLGLLRAGLFGGSKLMRVAFSALLRIEDNGRYLLIRNLHRRETFGPFGGVVKYFAEAQRSLDSFEFAPQAFNDEMARDLRGFLPSRHAGRIYSWYMKNKYRETATECIRRELAEEMREIGLAPKLRGPRNLRLEWVRTVIEGPEPVAGHDYKQFRVFEVYDPVLDSKTDKSLVRALVRTAGQHKDLVLASPQEIREGRCHSGELVGNHCCYLLWEKRIRPDIPIFVDVDVEKRKL